MPENIGLRSLKFGALISGALTNLIVLILISTRNISSVFIFAIYV